MARVKDWIGGFLQRHKARFAPHDWPADDATEEGREFLLGWLTGFATRVVTEDEANAASIALAATPPRFRNEHLPAVLGAIDATRKARGCEPGTTREAVRYASLDCPHCGGDGLAMAWTVVPDELRKIPETIAAYCVCRHGRWIRQAHAEKHPEHIRRIPDFAAVLAGYTPDWLDHPPGHPEFSVNYRPAPALPPVETFDRAKFNQMFQPA